jgi:prevent-host-death family protein
MSDRVVGSRELKIRLGTYLRQVRSGRTLVITDRGQPVAELRPLEGSRGDDAALARLAARGAVSLPQTPGVSRRPARPITSRGQSISSAILDGRKDRI